MQTIRAHLEQNLRAAGGYLLLVAPEGAGKSALAAKVTDLLAVPDMPLGPNADTVRQLAPWLPGVLLHMGKQSSQPDEITRLLLAQANTMLLRPVASPPSADPAADLDRAALAFSASPSRREIQRDSPRSNEMEYSLIRAQLADGTGLSQARYQRLVYEVLERLRDERGRAVIVIDALEEIGRHEDRLVFLPPSLPPGVTGLLTARPNTLAEKWAKQNLHNLTALKLDRLGREDIPPITRVPDDDTIGREFNDWVLERTSGVALVVRHIPDEIQPWRGLPAGFDWKAALTYCTAVKRTFGRTSEPRTFPTDWARYFSCLPCSSRSGH